MLAKLTAKNQLTLPKAVVDAIGPAQYFDVNMSEGQIVLTPVRIQRGDAVRAKLAQLGVTPADVAKAVEWARRGPRSGAAHEPDVNYAEDSNKSKRRVKKIAPAD